MVAKKVAGRKLDAGPKKLVPIPLGIEEITAETARPFHRWLIYAEPGTGKTGFAATSPNCLMLDADGGTDVIASLGIKGVKRRRIVDWQDMEDVLTYLQSGGHQNHDWVWLDGITLFQERGLHAIMLDLVETKSNRLVWQVDRGEYGQNMVRIMDWIRDMTELPINFGITAHAMRYTSPTTDEELLMPMVTQKNMPDKVCGYMSLVGYMTRRAVGDGKTEVALHTVKTATYYAKDHWNAIGTMVAPSVPKMLAKINAKIATAKSATPASPAKKAATPVKKGATKSVAKKG